MLIDVDGYEDGRHSIKGNMKLNLANILSGFNLTRINNNFTAIENELQNKVLYRDNPVGEPNSMENVLDMNSNQIINLPPPSAPNNAARLQDVVNATAGIVPAAVIPFAPTDTIEATNVQDAIEEVVEDMKLKTRSLFDFMTPAQINKVVTRGVYSAQDKIDMLASCVAAWTSALANRHNLFAPAGLYKIGDNHFPWRQEGAPVTLLDCGGITIFGEGSLSEFMTDSPDGADVFQLNGLDHLTIRDLRISAELTGFLDSGSNGISITNGFDRLVLMNLYMQNLPSVDDGPNVDGGKAVTVQPGTTPSVCGSLKVINLTVKGCAYGFGMDLDLVTTASKKMSVDVSNLTAENCYRSVVISAGAATGAITTALDFNVRVQGTSINSQQDVVLARVHGVDVDVQVAMNTTAAATRLNPLGIPWLASDTVVEGLLSLMVYNSKVKVSGTKNGADYKARIGATTAGASGLNGSTSNSDISVDIGGTATIADVFEVLSGGNSARLNTFYFTPRTTSVVPAGFYSPARMNRIEIQGSPTGSLLNVGRLRFPATADISADPNEMDAYARGTWTPTLADINLADEGATYTTRYGSYTRIGNRVFFNCTIAMSALGALTAGNSAFIIGLPFMSANVSGATYSASIGNASGLTLSAAATVHARVNPNQNYISLQKWLASSTAGMTPLLISDISATGVLSVSGSYATT